MKLKPPRKSTRYPETPPTADDQTTPGLTLPDPALPLNDPPLPLDDRPPTETKQVDTAKKADDTKGMTLRLPPELRKLLRQLAFDRECHMTTLIEEGIRLVLEKYGRKVA